MIGHSRLAVQIVALLVTLPVWPAIAQNGAGPGGGAAGPAPLGAAGPATLGAPGRQPANPIGPSGLGAVGAPSVDGGVNSGSEPPSESDRSTNVDPARPLSPPEPPIDQPSSGAVDPPTEGFDNPAGQVLPGGGDGSEVRNPAGSVLQGGGSGPSD